MNNSVRHFVVISALLSSIVPGCYGWQVAQVPEPAALLRPRLGENQQKRISKSVTPSVSMWSLRSVPLGV